MTVLFFFICFLASTIGAVVGAGGGVIIKPVIDATGLMPASTASFASSCTVLLMACCSMLRGRKDSVALQVRTAVPLAIGAVAGGMIGKMLFESVLGDFGNERLLGAIQAACLTFFTVIVLGYVISKDRLPSKHIKHPVASLAIGAILGCVSSFLGIGGGTSNVAVLFFFFSMDAKQAAKNSLFIIMFSQIANLALAIVTDTVPAFNPYVLASMLAGGIGGALLGAALSSKMTVKHVEIALKILLTVIIIINLSNFLKIVT